jgi:decaprenylphospho-beta-D-erythro-pentofuranosid-2-ulose 2-reductase
VNANNKKIVIVGATSLIAEHCARLWAAQAPAELILVARDADKAQAVAADLRVRSPGIAVRMLQTDFLDPHAIGQLADEAFAGGPVDIVLIAHGSLPQQQRCESDLQECRAALEVNALSPVLFAEAFAGRMQQAGRGTLAIIGSVAGDRGRKSNYVYGAAKGLVTRYAQGLQHRLAATPVRVVLIKPGPTDTPMTASMKAQGARLAPVDVVARAIVDGVAAGTPLVYAPKKWALIMMVVRHIPRFIFAKMDI